MKYQKFYVAVIVRIDTDGNIKPVAIEWTDGRRFEVSKVLSVRFAVPAHVGGVLTVRYDCIIEGQGRTLWREKDTGRWFIELQDKTP